MSTHTVDCKYRSCIPKELCTCGAAERLQARLDEAKQLLCGAHAALKRGRPQIIGILVQEDQDMAIRDIDAFLAKEKTT